MTDAFETPACDACGTTDAAVMFERSSDATAGDAFLPTTDEYRGYGRVVRCRKCGLVRLSPRPGPGFLTEAYRTSQDPLYMTEHASRLANARAWLRLVERHAQPGRLLDVGCGAGVLLEAASPRWQVAGVEPSAWAAAEARRTLGAEVFEGSLESAKLPDAGFDVVTMLDVIEHVPSPRQALAEVKRILKPGGAVFILTPDIGAPMARLMGRWWWGLRPAHLYYFSRTTLVNMLEREGFEVKARRRVGRRFSLGYWISRMRGYAPGLVSLASRIASGLRLSALPVYLNTFDSIAVVAVKR
jgi:2-polyprenyl-3-methyl-5-hydroxy-6-metoxy-1,4-benzoquinol methylase